MDYRIYRFTVREYFLYGGQYLLLILLFAYTFYRSYIAAMIMLPGFVLFLKRKKRLLIERKKQRLRMEFKEAVTAVSSGLGAGYSIENAFLEAAKDMVMLYGETGMITEEFHLMERNLTMNRTLEDCLNDLAVRSGVEDIRNFAVIFTAAKRSSGSLAEVICNTVEIIRDKEEMKQEIEVLISARQLEQKVMNVIPFLIVFYVGGSTGDMMDILYHNVAGIVVMTMCMIVYLLAVMLSERITDIKV